MNEQVKHIWTISYFKTKVELGNTAKQYHVKPK